MTSSSSRTRSALRDVLDTNQSAALSHSPPTNSPACRLTLKTTCWHKQARVRDAAVHRMIGGLLLIMGSQSRPESLFYYFCIED